MLKPALAQHFATYADFHRHPINQLTHKIAIPMIVFHIVAMLDWVGLADLGGFTLTLAHPVYLATMVWYVTLHPKLAAAMAVFYGVCFPVGWVTPWPVVVAVAVVGWTIQLAGHSVWEKRRPAFLTNLVQALIGPFFFAALLFGEWPPKSDAHPQ